MVCEKCEKKLGRVITPDTWKDGARNTTGDGFKTTTTTTTTRKFRKKFSRGLPRRAREARARRRLATNRRRRQRMPRRNQWHAENRKNVKRGGRAPFESGGRKLNENKMLTSKKARFDPYSKTGFAICRICKSSVHQAGSHYCQGCAYKKGICAMCGKKVLDTKNYRQTSV